MKSARGAFASHGSLRHKGQAIAHPKHHQGSTFHLTGAKVQKTSEKPTKKAEYLKLSPLI